MSIFLSLKTLSVEYSNAERVHSKSMDHLDLIIETI